MISPERWQWLEQVVERIGLTDAFLFGGAAFDWTAGDAEASDDVDLQGEGGAEAEAAFLAAVERDGGATLLSGPRDYRIFHDEPVRLFEVSVDGVMLDVNLMDTTVRPGHFSIETVRWSIPSRHLEDPHNALVEGHRPHLVTAPGSDNPVRMLSRLIRLARKYSVTLTSAPLRDTALELRRRAEEWAPADDFHGKDAWASYDRLIARVTQDADRNSGLLDELRALELVDLGRRSSVVEARDSGHHG